jgi:hypothetical protein
MVVFPRLSLKPQQSVSTFIAKLAAEVRLMLGIGSNRRGWTDHLLAAPVLLGVLHVQCRCMLIELHTSLAVNE